MEVGSVEPGQEAAEVGHGSPRGECTSEGEDALLVARQAAGCGHQLLAVDPEPVDLLPVADHPRVGGGGEPPAEAAEEQLDGGFLCVASASPVSERFDQQGWLTGPVLRWHGVKIGRASCRE